jgi:hypothetical protein
MLRGSHSTKSCSRQTTPEPYPTGKFIRGVTLANRAGRHPIGWCEIPVLTRQQIPEQIHPLDRSTVQSRFGPFSRTLPDWPILPVLLHVRCRHKGYRVYLPMSHLAFVENDLLPRAHVVEPSSSAESRW